MTTLLVDAHNLAYRAWHSPEVRHDTQLASETFIRVLRDDASALNVARRIAAVERSRSFRFRLYEGYKAGRKERTPELRAFIDRLPALAHQAGYEIWHAPDHEADDVLATFAVRLEGPVLIQTTDQDLYGCICERVRVVLPRAPGEAHRFVGVEEVRAKFGVSPERIPLYKALVGDTSDNIPGVTGLGKVKAEPLLERFDSLEALYAGLDSLGERHRNLLKGTPREQVELFYRLATLVKDAPVEQLLPDEITAPAELAAVAAPPPEPTPAWGIRWDLSPSLLAADDESEDDEDRALAFLAKHPAPDGLDISEWTADWRDQTGDLSPEVPSSFGWLLRVLADPRCPAAVLRDLSEFDRPPLNRLIAWHRNCPADLLESLLGSDDPATSAGVLSAPDRPVEIWRTLAAHSDSTLLESVARHSFDDLDVQHALATNRSTPDATLLQLVERGAVPARLALASRRSAPLDVWRKLAADPSVAVRRRLASNAHVANSVLEGLTGDHPGVLKALAGNRSTNNGTKTALADQESAELKRVLSSNISFHALWKVSGRDWSTDLVGHPLARPVYFHWAAGQGDTAKRTIARHGAGGLPALRKLVRDDDPAVRGALAGNPSCPPSLLARLARDPEPGVRGMVAIHSACPDEVRGQLRRDPHWHVRRLAQQDFPSQVGGPLPDLESLSWYGAYLMARHPSCPVQVLRQLAQHEDWRVRLAAGRHAACPPDVLEELAVNHDSWTDRVAVAGHARTSAATLERLALDSDLDVRSWVAANVACPPSLLSKLAHDQDWRVRLAAAEHPVCRAEALGVLAADSTLDLRQAVAIHPDVPPEVLTLLASDTDWTVRRAVAEHPSCPLDAADQLAKDTSWQVRTAVARRADCGSAVLAALAHDADDDVRQAVASHPYCPEATLRQLADAEEGPVRLAVARHATCPEDLLRDLAAQDDWELRAAVAARPDCPVELLPSLAEDEDLDVRAAVAGNVRALDRLAAEEGEDAVLNLLIALNEDEEAAVRLAFFRQPEGRVDFDYPSSDLDDAEVFGDRITLLNIEREAHQDALEAIAAEGSEQAKLAIAGRPDLLSSAISELLADLTPPLALRLLRNPAVTSRHAEQLDKQVSVEARQAYLRLAGPPDPRWLDLAPEFTGLFWSLVAASDHADWCDDAFTRLDDEYLRAALASNPHVPPHLLARLGQDQDPDVQQAMAANPATPPGVLQALASAESEALQVAIARHEGLPPHLFDRFALDPEDMLALLAGNAALPEHTQLLLACDPRKTVRSRLMQNPALSAVARKRLEAW